MSVDKLAALLSAREEELSAIYDNVPGIVFYIAVEPDGDFRFLSVSRDFLTATGLNREQVVGSLVREVIPPQSRDMVLNHYREAIRSGQPVRWEEKSVYPAGQKYGEVMVTPLYDASGLATHLIGIVHDITERKRSEEAVREREQQLRLATQAGRMYAYDWDVATDMVAGMTRKLIEAQEQERARIGRELHDDINQRLALLAVELGQLQDHPSDLQSRVQELQKAMAQISDDVQGLSHELHPSKLEYLGVVAGIKSFCKEFGKRQKMEIQFGSDVRSPLPQEIGLTLLRVLQEALHNAVKHSGVRKVSVQLREDSREIRLVVSDAGKGFETEGAFRGEGLGLTSMRERIRLVNGTIAIDSKPMGGTTIYVRVPLGSGKLSERAAG